MKLVFQWIDPICRFPRWMAFAYYSAERNRCLFVVFPLHFIVAFVWWIQLHWSRMAAQPSWIEREIRARVKLERALREGWQ